MQSNKSIQDKAIALTKENAAEIARMLNAPRISVDYSGIKKLYKEIIDFCHDWKNRTADGISLRLTQCNDCLFIIKTSLLEKEDMSLEQANELNLLKGQFEELRELIQNKQARDSFKTSQENDDLKRIENYFNTADNLKTGNAHRDEHIFNLYEAIESRQEFRDVENALYVFSLATGGLWLHRIAPLSAMGWLTGLFEEHSLTVSQRHLILTHLIAYAETTPQEKTVSWDKIVRLMKAEEYKIASSIEQAKALPLIQHPERYPNVTTLERSNAISMEESKNLVS